MNANNKPKKRIGGALSAVCVIALAGAVVAPSAAAAAEVQHLPRATTATIAAPAPAPAPAQSATTGSVKPGLIAADKLRVLEETGEFNGDEPVMLTVRVETVLGQQGSTRVSLVNDAPGEIASGVDAGDEVGIPDRYGDIWINLVKPLSTDAVARAIDSKTPVPIPVVMTATVMLEGDLSNGPMIGQMGQTVVNHLQAKVAPELENTKIMMKSVDEISGYEGALDRIGAAAKPDSAVITDLVLQKIKDWAASFSDPDDPAGVSLTALVPVDESVTDLIEAGGGPKKIGLDSQYLRLDHKSVRTPVFDTDIEIRTGLLVPPSALDGREQQWWTTYSSDYIGDAPVKYAVWNHAWPTITW